MSPKFSGRIVVEYVNGKSWLLMEDFGYFSDLLDKAIIVPAGFLTDFHTIPWGLWSVLPKTYYGQAAVIHDYLLTFDDVTRKQADQVFREALIHLGAPRWRVKVMYAGVRLGAAWRRVQQWF